jgi:hypothetical protein
VCVCVVYNLVSWGFRAGVHRLKKNGSPQNYWRQKDVSRFHPEGPHIRRHRTKFSRPDGLAPAIWNTRTMLRVSVEVHVDMWEDAVRSVFYSTLVCEIARGSRWTLFKWGYTLGIVTWGCSVHGPFQGVNCLAMEERSKTYAHRNSWCRGCTCIIMWRAFEHF